MAALTSSELAVVRSWVGDEVSDADLNDRYDRLRNVDDVVLETLRHRRAVLANDEPGVFVADGITINQTENARLIGAVIDKFILAGGSGLEDTFEGQVGVSQFTRQEAR